MTKPENPSAFPCIGEGPNAPHFAEGMTLRDYFAGQVDVQAYDPVATLKDAKGRLPTIDELAEYIAGIRMAEACAMLAAREE